MAGVEHTSSTVSWLVLAVGGGAFALAARVAIVYYYDEKYLPPALEIGAQALWVVFALLLAVPTVAIVGYRWLRPQPGAAWAA